MNLLKKIGRHCAVWGLAFCTVTISPVILIYSVPFGIGIVSDLVQASDGRVVALLLAGAVLLWVFRPVVRPAV